MKNHKSCALAGKVVISGGVLDENKINPCFYIFDLTSNTWKEPEAKMPEWKGRIGHSMTPCYKHTIIDLYLKPV